MQEMVIVIGDCLGSRHRIGCDGVLEAGYQMGWGGSSQQEVRRGRYWMHYVMVDLEIERVAEVAESWEVSWIFPSERILPR